MSSEPRGFSQATARAVLGQAYLDENSPGWTQQVDTAECDNTGYCLAGWAYSQYTPPPRSRLARLMARIRGSR